jgi:hypothetical protein
LVVFAFWIARQDHFTAIALDGDASWFESYEPNGEMQDLDLFFHGIGNSIRNVQRADVIFLGASRPLAALDWQIFESFAQNHRVAMFNMAFGGVVSGEFAQAIIHKWQLRQKLWVIDVVATNSPTTSFFYGLSQEGSERLPQTRAIRELMRYSWFRLCQCRAPQPGLADQARHGDAECVLLSIDDKRQLELGQVPPKAGRQSNNSGTGRTTVPGFG